ncbi:MAG: Obg family GTPase [Planctomycetota bacterium]|nr:MAG: Obg family GTPase [Planctomycetota bacterium]
MFRDQLHLFLKAGDGGRGCVSFLREKFMPKGGPDGGDGGRGGDIVLVAKPGMNTLYHLTHQVHVKAEDGQKGQGCNCYGKYGKDREVLVPVGTIVKDRETGVVLKDMVRAEERVVICQGGKGGRGNKTFAGPTNQVPFRYEDGQNGEQRWVELELKLIADVGLVGLPNAGKSTLLAHVSDARPKIADYPFTTLIPQPGIVSGPGYRSFVMADLPGLIEGAHEGVGLGTQFLKHIERTRVIVHIVDLAPLAGLRPAEAYRVIRKELERYSTQLAAKPEVIAGNKIDLPGWEKGLAELKKASRRDVLPISAATGKGLKELTARLFKEIERLGKTSEIPMTLPQKMKPMVGDEAPKPALINPPAPRETRKAPRHRGSPKRVAARRRKPAAGVKARKRR